MLALSPPELLELLKTLPADRTAFVWGPPGIGKSALVRAAGQELVLPCVVLLGTQLAFVRARPDRLCETPPSDATPAYPTPRAWHMLSDTIAATGAKLWPALAAGTVGDRAGAEFAAFAERALDAPTLEAIARGEAQV